MSISAITGSSRNTLPSNVQQNKSTEAKSSSQSESKSSSINYSSASDADLEALAAQGDVRAQNELARRKAAEEAENKSSNSTGNTGFHVEA